MAQTRPGGVYKVGDRFVDAEGNEAQAPSRREAAEERTADEQAERDLQRAAAEQGRLAAEAPAVPRRAGR